MKNEEEDQSTPVGTEISLIQLIDLREQPSVQQLWLVPGSLDDLDDGGEFSGWHIDDYLQRRGLCLGLDLTVNESEAKLNDAATKLAHSGFLVTKHVTAND